MSVIVSVIYALSLNVFATHSGPEKQSLKWEDIPLPSFSITSAITSAIFVGCIAYADALILLSVSVCNLQKMLTICDNVGRQLDILFNAKKFSLFKVGKIYKVDLEQLQIGNSNIHWSNNMKYLGLNFCSEKRFTGHTSSTIQKLHAAANAVFSHTKYVSAVLKLSLINAYVLPVVTYYALEAVSLTDGEYDELSVC